MGEPMDQNRIFRLIRSLSPAKTRRCLGRYGRNAALCQIFSACLLTRP